MPVLNVPKTKKRSPEQIRKQRENIAKYFKGNENSTLKAIRNKMMSVFGEKKPAHAKGR